jgi:hypothetical protein
MDRVYKFYRIDDTSCRYCGDRSAFLMRDVGGYHIDYFCPPCAQEAKGSGWRFHETVSEEDGGKTVRRLV